MDHLDPVTKGKILTARVAAHWGIEAAYASDADYRLVNDTADAAWLAYQALIALNELDPQRAELIVRQFDMGVDVAELAQDALDRVMPDPCWEHRPLRDDDALEAV
ncbi:hypothetical protein ACIP69_18175 [Streptomyces hygroscopicus]|uniref:hypothetical protein n=1 Tax=Streptomyces hygroscopicus TaxID=1912 RepID=UPI003809B2BC